MKTATYDVWSVDAWGNPRDGFEMNDRARIGQVTLPHAPTDQQIVRALVDGGYLKSARFKFEISGESEYSLYVDHAPTGEPLLQLERITKESEV